MNLTPRATYLALLLTHTADGDEQEGNQAASLSRLIGSLVCIDKVAADAELIINWLIRNNRGMLLSFSPLVNSDVLYIR